MRSFPPVDGVEHRYVQVGGLRMHIAEAGPADGEPVLLLHGWPQHWYTWRRVVPLLSDRYRLIMPDLRGFGWTDAPRSSYSKDEFADDIVRLLHELDLHDVRLAGHDWGGWTAFLVAARAPERLRSVVGFSIAVPWARGAQSPAGVLAVLAYLPWIATPVLGPALQRYTPFVDLLFRGTGGSRIWSEEERRAFTDVFRDPDRAEAASRVYRTFLTRELRAPRPRVDLQIPARLIVGRGDPVISESLVRDAGMPVEFVTGGHFLPEERPELVAEAIGG